MGDATDSSRPGPQNPSPSFNHFLFLCSVDNCGSYVPVLVTGPDNQKVSTADHQPAAGGGGGVPLTRARTITGAHVACAVRDPTRPACDFFPLSVHPGQKGASAGKGLSSPPADRVRSGGPGTAGGGIAESSGAASPELGRGARAHPLPQPPPAPRGRRSSCRSPGALCLAGTRAALGEVGFS